MKEIIYSPDYINYDTIKIRKNTPTLDYLLKNNIQFRLQQITSDEFCLLKEIDSIEWQKYQLKKEKQLIAGYNKFKKGEYIRSSGGLKLSDPTQEIIGSFIIEEKRIIYDPTVPFFAERDCFVYGGQTYYTTMSIQDLLMEMLKRKYYVYEGELINYQKLNQGGEILTPITKEQLIEFFTDANKSNLAHSNVKSRIKRKNGEIDII